MWRQQRFCRHMCGDNNVSVVTCVATVSFMLDNAGLDLSEQGNYKKKFFLKKWFYIFQSYIAGTWLTIADLSVLASITQLEAMDYKLTGYRLGSVHPSWYKVIRLLK